MYPNEEIYYRTNGVTISSKDDKKEQDGTVIVTTHRILYLKNG
jgi:hypothetical protein